MEYLECATFHTHAPVLLRRFRDITQVSGVGGTNSQHQIFFPAQHRGALAQFMIDVECDP